MSRYSAGRGRLTKPIAIQNPVSAVLRQRDDVGQTRTKTHVGGKYRSAMTRVGYYMTLVERLGLWPATGGIGGRCDASVGW